MKYVALLLAITALLFVYGCAQGSVKDESQTVKQGVDIVKAEGQGMIVAEAGDTVSVNYIGALENGTLFDTSIEAEAKKANLPLRPAYSPLSFTVGAGQMIEGFDSAVVGMKEGQEKTVTIPPEEAYGVWSQENNHPLAGKTLVFTIRMVKITKAS